MQDAPAAPAEPAPFALSDVIVSAPIGVSHSAALSARITRADGAPQIVDASASIAFVGDRDGDAPLAPGPVGLALFDGIDVGTGAFMAEGDARTSAPLGKGDALVTVELDVLPVDGGETASVRLVELVRFEVR